MKTAKNQNENGICCPEANVVATDTEISKSSVSRRQIIQASVSVSEHDNEETDLKSSSTESLTQLTGQNKTLWYWVKLAVFVSSPFLARQLGIFAGKRIMRRLIKD